MQKLRFAFILTLSFCVAANAFPEGKPEGVTEHGTPAVPKPLDHDKLTSPNDTSESINRVHKEPIETAEHSQDVKPTAIETSNVIVNVSSTAVPPVNQAETKKTVNPETETTKKPEPTTPTIITPSTSSTTTSTTPATIPSTSKVTTTAPSVTTDHSKVVSTTIVPAAAARGFDGASFVGGIILTMGLMAVGYLGFKYYKKSELNYHTL